MFAGARERGLLRESMQGIVPDSIRYRVDKARPFEAFTELFVASGGKDSLGDLLTMREMARMGIVDAQEYRDCFTAFARNPGGASPSAWGPLWGAITAEAFARWFSAFNVRTDSALSETALSETTCV